MASSSGSKRGPLQHLRVLDCATFIAAPFAASLLAEFGADVIKVEQPRTGDNLRQFGMPTESGDSLAWLSEARNKKSITLDLRTEKGSELFRQLAGKSDVICENFRPGTLARWGLGYDRLSQENPGLILLQISGYGQTGPNAQRPGFARIAHAFGGLSHLAGMPDGPPVTPGSTSLADYMSGLFGAFAVMVALRHRDQTGEGQTIDLALYESVFRALDDLAPAHALFGTTRGRQGVMTSVACPHGHFQCGDGQWVAIACTSDRMFARLADAMGQSELAAPDRFMTTQQRLSKSNEVDQLVKAWVSAQRRENVIDRCHQYDVPCAAVNTIEDIFADPHIAARQVLTKLFHENLGDITIPNVVPRLSRSPGSVTHLGPALGAHNDEIYGGLLGLDADQIASLKRAGVV